MIPQRWHSASASYSKEHLGQDEVVTEDMVIVRSCDSEQYRKPYASAETQETKVFLRRKVQCEPKIDWRGALFGCRWQRSGEVKLPQLDLFQRLFHQTMDIQRRFGTPHLV